MSKVNNDSAIECCGLSELADIADNQDNPKQTIKEVCRDMYGEDSKSAFLVFSDIKKKIAGKNLARYIIKNNLGRITKSPSAINTNSGNSLTIWTWTINKRNLYNFWITMQKEQYGDQYRNYI